MGDLLETLLDITFFIIRFLFTLPGELAIMKATNWGIPPIGWLKGLAILISLCFWSIVGFLIYLLTLTLGMAS